MLKDSPIFAYVPVSDMGRARKFYEQTLGLEPREESPGGVLYECAGGTRFFMYPSAGAGTSKASTAFWEVKDVEKEVAELRKKGVRFEEYDLPQLKTVNGVAVAGGNKSAWFKDPDGNILALIQRI